MSILFMAILLGLIPGMVAQNKGRSFLPWWIYGSLLFIIALPHALLLRPTTEQIEQQQAAQGLKKCPFCAEMIKPDAKVCRYCGRDLPAPEQPTSAPARVVMEGDISWDDPSGSSGSATTATVRKTGWKTAREQLEELRNREQQRARQSGVDKA